MTGGRTKLDVHVTAHGVGAVLGILPASAPADSIAASSAAVSLAGRREAISACLAALAGVRGVLVACSDRDLVVLAGELAEVRALAGAGVVAVTAEAEARGVVAASRCASTAAWVADAAWHSRREAATIAKAAALFRQADCEPVADAVCAGDVDLASAVACGQEFAKLAPDLAAAAKPVVVEQLLDIAGEHGPSGVRRLTDEILARYGAAASFAEQCARRRRHIELSVGRHTEGGLWDYRLTVDGEGRAVLEAAIGPGSAPKPPSTADSGDGLAVTTRDTRPVGRRRGEALIDALRRSVTAAEHGRPPASPKAIVMLTMDYRDLAGVITTRLDTYRHHDDRTTGQAQCGLGSPPHDSARPDPPGAATVLGSLATGELLSPDTVRRIACDAGIIPVVLGRDGEILDQGRMERLFTPGQIRALWRRDRHCTFPGCDIPAAWCDAHHLVHWADGGATDLSNAALLCARHHTIVHRDQLAGQVTCRVRTPKPAARTGATAAEPARARGPAASVMWDLRPGSYHPPESADLDQRLSA